MSVTPAHARTQQTEAAPPAGSTGHETKLGLLRVAKAVVVFVYAFVLVNLVMLTLGFFLRLFGASTDAEFTRWVYRSVDRIMEPFRGMFPSHVVSDHSVIDVSLLFAMIVYAIAGITLHALVTWLTDKIVVLRRHQRMAAQQAAAPGGPAVPPAGPPTGPYGAPTASR
jgi:uncharacterized protein YggT (Ycf19 family)